MRYIKHFIKVSKYYFNRITCKHNSEKEKASCPFTGKTYIYCSRCGIKVETFDTI